MSTGIQVILWISKPSYQLKRLYQQVQIEEPVSQTIVNSHYGSYWNIKNWEYEVGKTLNGPGGWSLRCHQYTITFYHIAKFGLTDFKAPEDRAVIETIDWFGSIIGAKHAIFTHELFPVKDLLYTESIKALKKEFNAANTWNQMCEAGLFKDYCWLPVNLPIIHNV